MKDIKSIIDEAFLAMCTEYNEIFKNFYPGLKSAGFNESNLVQKFMFHYKIKNPNIITWSELSMKYLDDDSSELKLGRLDGVIIDYEKDFFIIIEAKRFNHKRKIEWSIEDVNRSIRIEGNDHYTLPNHCYTLVLGDIWEEGSEIGPRRQWIKQWVDNNPLSAHKELKPAIRTLQHRCRLLPIPKHGNYHLVYSLFDCTKKDL
jgi:hypothetical protein